MKTNKRTANAGEIVQQFQQAIGRGDVAAARKYLDDNLSFQGPFDNFDKPEPYLESLGKLHPIVEGVDVKRMFVDGADVCLLYDLRYALGADKSAGVSFIAEWFQVKGDKIASIRVAFDARPFEPLFRR